MTKAIGDFIGKIKRFADSITSPKIRLLFFVGLGLLLFGLGILLIRIVIALAALAIPLGFLLLFVVGVYLLADSLARRLRRNQRL